MVGNPIVGNSTSQRPEEDAEKGSEKPNGTDAAREFQDEPDKDESDRPRSDTDADIKAPKRPEMSQRRASERRATCRGWMPSEP